MAANRTYFGGSVQPSEPAKIVIIIYVSAWLASKGSLIQDVRVGLVPFSVLMGIVTVLIVTQPDISTAILIVTTASIMFFIAGAKLRQLLIIGVGIAATFALVINYSSYAERPGHQILGWTIRIHWRALSGRPSRAFRP